MPFDACGCGAALNLTCFYSTMPLAKATLHSYIGADFCITDFVRGSGRKK
jgi:hypothetical protein